MKICKLNITQELFYYQYLIVNTIKYIQVYNYNNKKYIRTFSKSFFKQNFTDILKERKLKLNQLKTNTIKDDTL